MAKEFKLLLGNRLYVELPEIPESPIILDEATKQAIAASEREKYSKLTVYAVGDSIKNIQEGDVILVDPKVLPNCPVISLSEKKDVILVSPFDVIHIW